MSINCDVIVIFFIYGEFGAIWKLDSRHIGITQTKVHFLILYMCVYLCTKFQVSSIILTNVRLRGWGWGWDWGNFNPTTSKWIPKKPTQIWVKRGFSLVELFCVKQTFSSKYFCPKFFLISTTEKSVCYMKKAQVTFILDETKAAIKRCSHISALDNAIHQCNFSVLMSKIPKKCLRRISAFVELQVYGLQRY